MAAAGSSVLPASALLTALKIITYDLPDANTEYEITLPTNAKKITAQLREGVLLKLADTSGDIASGLYFSLFPGNAYNADSIKGNGAIILYVQASKASQILEVLYWV